MPVPVDLAGADATGTHGEEVVREHQGNDRDGNRADPAPPALPIDGAPAAGRVGRDHEDADARVDGASERVLQRPELERPSGKATPDPSVEMATSDRVRLDAGAVRLRMCGEERLGGHPDGDRATQVERGGDQRFVPDVQSVKGPAKDRPGVPRHRRNDLHHVVGEEQDQQQETRRDQEVDVVPTRTHRRLELRGVRFAACLLVGGTEFPADLAVPMIGR